MKTFILLIFVQTFFIATSFASMENLENKKIKYCNFFKENEKLGHAYDDLVKELSLRSNLQFVNIKAPIKRCIQMMIAGEIDLMTSVRVDEYTSKYMSFLFVSDQETSIIFLTRKSDGNWLNDYADLQGKTVGTSYGFGYFEKFDLDETLKKFKTNNTNQLPRLLEAGRVDAYVTYKGLADHAEGYSNIIQAPYSVGVKMARLAIGIGSPLQEQSVLIEATMKSIIEDGTLDRILPKLVPEYQEKPSE